MKILLVEDDTKTVDFILKGLNEEGYITCHTPNGQKGFTKAMTEEFDVIVTDVMMPEVDGFEMIKRLRAEHISTPILILSAKSAVDDRVKGLRLGGDDYLVKPFAFAELVARIETIARRQLQSPPMSYIDIADLHIDLLTHKVCRGDQAIFLAPLEFNLLAYLAKNQGRVISRTMIIEHVWDYNFDPGTNVVEARICCLRDKIDKPFAHKLIYTVRGAGYTLEARG